MVVVLFDGVCVWKVYVDGGVVEFGVVVEGVVGFVYDVWCVCYVFYVVGDVEVVFVVGDCVCCVYYCL